MSKTTGKRGLARTQATAAILGINSPEWDAAKSAFDAAEKVHDEACEAERNRAGGAYDPPAESLQAFFAARDRLLGTPIPNGEALAYKFAVYCQATDGAELRREEDRQWTFEHGDDEERAALAVYFDALALSGVVATVSPPRIVSSWDAARDAYTALGEELERANASDEDISDVAARRADALAQLLALNAPDWPGVAFKVRIVAMLVRGLDVTDEAEMADAALRQDLTGRLARLYSLAATATEQADAVLATAELELMGRDFAAEVYPGFACNPDGLREIASALAGAQADARSLLRHIDPMAGAAIIDRVFFSKPEGDDPPPHGPGGGLPLPSGPTTEDSTPCPAATLIAQIEASLDSEAAAGGERPEWTAHYEARKTLEDQASEVVARSVRGAVGQIVLALDRAELIRGNTDQAIRDEHHDAAERLIRSALGVLGGVSPSMWDGYIGGARPAPPMPAGDGPKFLRWEAEAERLMAEHRLLDGALSAEEEEAETARLFDTALRILYQILTTPGTGSTVAAVKLRALLHPDVGVAHLLGQMAEDDAEGIHTALAALTGEEVFNPFAWIRDYEKEGARVRKVRVDIGGGDDRFALLFSHGDTAEAQQRHARLVAIAQGHDPIWALFHAAQNEVMPGAAPRTISEITRAEEAAGRDVAAVVFPPLSQEGV